VWVTVCVCVCVRACVYKRNSVILHTVCNVIRFYSGHCVSGGVVPPPTGRSRTTVLKWLFNAVDSIVDNISDLDPYL
jgi:hypothetical protein